MRAQALDLPDARGQYDGWQAELHGRPKVFQQDRQLEIDVAFEGDGLYLTREIDRGQRYRLRVEGKGGLHFMLRIRKDAGRYDYYCASGKVTQTIHSASRLELLLYCERPSHYRLAALSLTPCTDCVTSEDLRPRIYADVPALDQAQGLDRAILLLKWAANVVTWATDRDALFNLAFDMSPAEVLYNLFDKRLGGVMCGGHAMFYTRVLHLFGIEAFTINYGNPVLNHVSVVVPHAGRHYLLDPSFAAYYVRNGKPIPLEDLIESDTNRALANVDLIELGIEDRRYMGREIPTDFYSSAPEKVNGFLVCKSRWTSPLACFLTNFDSDFAAAGLQRDRTALLRLLYLGVFGVGSSMHGSARRIFIRTLARLGIPTHAGLSAWKSAYGRARFWLHSWRRGRI